MRQNAHLEGTCAARHLGANPAQANDPEHLVAQFHPDERGRCPLAAPDRSTCRANIPGMGKHQRERMFGNGNRRGAGRIDHDHAPSGGLVDIDVVNPDTCAPDNPQTRPRLEDGTCDLGGTSHNERIEVAYTVDEFLRCHARANGDIRVGLQDLKTCPRKRVGHQDP